MSAAPTVLVVDDDAPARAVMRAALRRAGYAVVEAGGGEAGLERFRAGGIDMVMLDVDMPGLDGLEVCRRLRAEAGPQLPIVMVTGMDDIASVEVAYEAGATDFMAKPVNWALVGHRVRYLFRSHRVMRDLQAEQARIAALLTAIPDLLFELDLDGRYLDYRASRSELLTVPAQTLLGRTVREVLPAAAADVTLAALQRAHREGAASGAQFSLRLGERQTWFELSVARKETPPGELPRFIVLSRDITERREADQRIAQMAYFDSLTGLANRRAFHERVDREVARALRQGTRLAVLFMDLDRFKDVNDSMGHAAGDELLTQVAARLRDSVRPADLVSRATAAPADADADHQLARLGGDEFTALLCGLDAVDDALKVAQRIGRIMRRPFSVDGRPVSLTASIGMASFPDDGHDAATLLQHADTAMYHAKRSGRDNTQVYSGVLTQRLRARVAIDQALRGALERGELHLVYQPQVDLAAGRVVSLEALLRWTHPELGAIAPLDFIPLAEENGLIEALGAWVLRTACADAAGWLGPHGPVGLAVNVSTRQCASGQIVPQVEAALAASGLAPQRLELELTESAFLDVDAAPGRPLHLLHERGVGVALDDFGTGYSSLSYLSRMPIDKLKIDRSFVAGLAVDGHSEAIVRAVIAMAAGLGLTVTAEGVETPGQARALRRLDCACQQGYLLSRPVPAAEVPALLGRRWAID